MAEGQPDVMGAWLCAKREQFEEGPRTYCPPEGCPKDFCARDDAGWLPGMPTPPRCEHIVEAATVPWSQSFDMVEGKTLSQLAIDDLVEGLRELTRYRNDGPACNWPFGETDVLCLLGEALDHAAQIERNALEEQPAYIDRLHGLNQLTAAIDAFPSSKGRIYERGGSQHRPLFRRGYRRPEGW